MGSGYPERQQGFPILSLTNNAHLLGSQMLYIIPVLVTSTISTEALVGNASFQSHLEITYLDSVFGRMVNQTCLCLDVSLRSPLLFTILLRYRAGMQKTQREIRGQFTMRPLPNARQKPRLRPVHLPMALIAMYQ
jgi:hypothetical protein